MTLTGETAWCVPAQAVVTQMPVHQTLIDVDAVFSCQVYLEAFVAGALVCPQHVFTHTILANVRVEGTFIDISAITSYARATGAQSQKLSRALRWTWLAGFSVGVFSAGTTALRLGHSSK